MEKGGGKRKQPRLTQETLYFRHSLLAWLMTREWRRQEKHGHSFFFFPNSVLVSLTFAILSTSVGVTPWYATSSSPRTFALFPSRPYPYSTAIARETGYSARNPPPWKTVDCFPRPQVDVTMDEQPGFPTTRRPCTLDVFIPVTHLPSCSRATVHDCNQLVYVWLAPTVIVCLFYLQPRYWTIESLTRWPHPLVYVRLAILTKPPLAVYYARISAILPPPRGGSNTTWRRRRYQIVL